MANLYIAANGASPTTAAQVVVATGNAIKTLLQVATPSTENLKIVKWGVSFDGSAAATPIKVELLQTDVAATTGTSLTPTVFAPSDAPPSLCAGGAALTCFSPSVEGTTTVARMFDVQLVPPTGSYFWEFSLGREPVVPISKFLRIRVTAAATVNAYAFILWEE